MAGLPLHANLATFYIQWPEDAVISLITHRRRYQPLFVMSRISEQTPLWTLIAQKIGRDHPNFAPTPTQCLIFSYSINRLSIFITNHILIYIFIHFLGRNKWNALRSGFMNMERLLIDNPDGFSTRTPTMHDEQFHELLTDQFWLSECNYLLFN